MKTRYNSFIQSIPLYSAFAILMGANPVHAAASDSLEAGEIIDRFISTQSADSEMAFIRMEMLQQGERIDERRLLALYETGPDKNRRSLVRVVRPKDVEGVTVLALVDVDGKTQQSIYLPAIGRTRPLAGEAHAAPFLGSDFSYADLLSEIPGSQKYTRREDALAMEASCFVIRAHPRSEDALYGFRDLYIEQKTFRLFRIEYYNEDSALVKTLNCFEYDSPLIFGRTTRPHRAVMSNPNTGTSTIFTVIVGRIGDDFDDAFFTPVFVENWTPEAVEDFMFQHDIVITAPSSAK